MIAFSAGLLAGAVLVGAVLWWQRRRTASRLAQMMAEVMSGTALSTLPADDLERSVLVAMEALNDANRTQLEAANAELRLREQSLSGIAEAVVLLDTDGQIVYANTAAEETLGRALSGRGLRHNVLTNLAEQAKSGEAQQISFDDPIEQRVYHASARIVDDSGYAVVVVRDETETRRLAAVRRDFVADASHELKTPVSAIRAAIETVILALADGDLDAAQRFSEKVRGSAERLSNLVGDLLDLSRLESAVERGGVIELGSVVHAEVNRRAGAKPSPTFHSVATPLEVVGISSDLALAVGNLLSNAIRYTPADGSVTVRLLPEEGWVTIEVTDTGSGIPSKDLPRVFERFYRVDPARSRATGGTGLGLSIVRHVVESHGGSVAASSILGEGSTFRIRLPLAPEID